MPKTRDAMHAMKIGDSFGFAASHKFIVLAEIKADLVRAFVIRKDHTGKHDWRIWRAE